MEQVEIKREWKPIEGYEGIYDLRDDGLIYSHPRNGTKGGYTKGHLDATKDYLVFQLTRNGKIKRINVLVYETFVGPIPKGYDIHHINGNSKDNRVENLKMIHHIEHTVLHINKIKRKVLQYTLDGEFIAEYESTMDAERQTGINHSHIGKCCNNKPKYKSAGGFIWKYKEVA